MDKEDKEEDAGESEDDKGEPPKDLSLKIGELEARQKLYEEYLAELSKSGNSQKLITDPEARMMHSHKDGFHCCYNVQTAVDHSTHLIADYIVTNHINDQGILHKFSEQLKKTMQIPSVSVMADKGYDSREEIETCILHGIVPYVGFKDDKEERILTLYYEKKDINEKMCRSTDPKDISACLHAGILPSCYENTNISVEVRKEGQLGCFLRSSDQKTVICPMGFASQNKNQGRRNGLCQQDGM